MRIIGGSHRGRKLTKLDDWQIRPTADRIREALFNILGPKIHNAVVLDLFAGTGALGIEALSRGASHVTFIDQACDIIRQNLKLCRLEEKARVIPCNILKERLPESLNGHGFDIIFMDPPYGKGYIGQVLQRKTFLDLMNENSIIIAEHSCKESIQIGYSGLDIFRQKKYSKTLISFINKT